MVEPKYPLIANFSLNGHATGTAQAGGPSDIPGH
jgi:hypothetical protein